MFGAPFLGFNATNASTVSKARRVEGEDTAPIQTQNPINSTPVRFENLANMSNRPPIQIPSYTFSGSNQSYDATNQMMKDMPSYNFTSNGPNGAPTIGWMTNTSVNIQREVVSANIPYMQREQLLICARDRVDEGQTRIGGGAYNVWNIVSFNYEMARIWRSGDAISARELWKDFFLDGLVLYEDNRKDTELKFTPLGTKKRTILTIGKMGQVTMRNIFSSRLREGTPLFLILKRARYTVPRLTFDVAGLGTSTQVIENISGTMFPWQLYPFADPECESVPEQELMFECEDGTIDYGIAIPFGRSISDTSGPSYYADTCRNTSFINDAKAFMTRKEISVLLNVV